MSSEYSTAPANSIIGEAASWRGISERQGTKAVRRWLIPRRPRCPITSARFTSARTATDGCSVAATMDVFSSYTKPTCLPAALRPKSSSETFSEVAKRVPSIKRLPGWLALSSTTTDPEAAHASSAEGEGDHHDQVGFALPCVLVAVILRGRSDGRRADRGHAALDGRPAGRCSAAPRHAGIR